MIRHGARVSGEQGIKFTTYTSLGNASTKKKDDMGQTSSHLGHGGAFAFLFSSLFSSVSRGKKISRRRIRLRFSFAFIHFASDAPARLATASNQRMRSFRISALFRFPSPGARQP
jgi:hypothetical protein